MSWIIRLSLILLPVFAIIAPWYNKRVLREKVRIVKAAYKELGEQGKLIVPERNDVDVSFVPIAGMADPLRIVFSASNPHLSKTVYRASIRGKSVYFEDCETLEVHIHPIPIKLGDDN